MSWWGSVVFSNQDLVPRDACSQELLLFFKSFQGTEIKFVFLKKSLLEVDISSCNLICTVIFL